MNLRVLAFSLGATMCSLAMAQPYTVTVSGHITECTPEIASGFVMIETVQNTQPYDSVMVPLNENCYYEHTFIVDDPIGWFQVWGSCADGTSDVNSGQYTSDGNGEASITIDLSCGGLLTDCEGVAGGSALPGTPCDDNDPSTVNDAWTADCECLGMNSDCFANFSLASNAPYTLNFTNLSLGDNLTYTWQLPMGEASSDFEPDAYVFPQSEQYQAYGVCLTVAGNGCTSWHCDTVYVNPNGGITFDQPLPWDCEGVMGGSAVPGSACDDGNSNTINDTWTADCSCVGTSVGECEALFTWQQTMSGNDLVPFSITTTNLSSGTGVISYSWSYINGDVSTEFEPVINISGIDTIFGICLDITDANGCTSSHCEMMFVDSEGNVTSVGNLTDCNGVPGGNAMPGTPCDDGDPATSNDTWSPDCECAGTTEPGICEAGYWVIQAFDSSNGAIEPIPFELWVWNLSTSPADAQYLWDFGDGTTSTEEFPTHVYADSGPYMLCLSVFGGGCTDTYCDTINVDGDGLLNGMMPGGNDRNALTLNVLDSEPLATAVNDNAAMDDLSVWPNPATDVMTITLNSTIKGNTLVTIIDMNGRVIRTLNSSFNKGRNSLTIPVADLGNGMYSIRIENAGNVVSHRFVKH